MIIDKSKKHEPTEVVFNPQIITMSYVDFREQIYLLLDEYDEYRTQPNTAPRIELEDSIDNLLTYLKKDS